MYVLLYVRLRRTVFYIAPGEPGDSFLFVKYRSALLSPSQVLVDTAYETKRMRSTLAENMAARMSLESQRREEIIVYNRELREKATAQKAKVRGRGRPRRPARPPAALLCVGESRLRRRSIPIARL